MTHFAKILTTTALAITLGACATADNAETKVAAMEAKEQAMMAEKTAEKAEMAAMDAEKTAMMAEKKAEMAAMDAKKATMMAENPMVGGAPMMANKTIVENASMAPNLTTLVAAVKQAELVETLSGPGPFTVFAPTDTAFSYLPAETTSSLMQDENKEALQKVLTAHVVAGTVTSSDLVGLIQSGGGSYSATTVSGDTLMFFISGEDVKVSDENGMVATVTTADVMQSNGVVHVVNSVLVPK